MAKLENGISGSASGKIGEYVFYTLYGKPCVRSRPKRGSFKQTPARQRQQSRMNIITAFLSHFKALVRITFAGISEGRAPYHTAFSVNARHALKQDDNGNWFLSYPDTILSVGALVLPNQMHVEKEGEGLNFQWDNYGGDNQDHLVVMVQHAQTHGVEFSFTGIPRKKQHCFWEPIQSGEMHVWVAFRSADQQHMSPSLYLGLV